MLLAAREVLERGAEGAFLHHPKVDLDPFLREHGGFRASVRQDLPDHRQAGERRHDLFRPRRRGHDVDVLDRFLPPAEGARHGDPSQGGLGPQFPDDGVGDGNRPPQRVPFPSPPHHVDPLADVLFRLFLDSRKPRQLPLPGERLEVVKASHARFLVQHLCGLRPDPRDPEDVEQPRRNLRFQVLVQVDAPRPEKLPDLFDEVRPDPGDGPKLLVGHLGDIPGQAPDVQRRPLVRPDAERVAALQFQEGGDFVENDGDLRVLHLPFLLMGIPYPIIGRWHADRKGFRPVTW